MKQRLDDHAQLTPWVIRVDPYPGESFGHFVARFRRANCLSVGSLASMLGQRPYVISYWETPSRRRRPDRQQLKSLADLMGIEVKSLRSTLLPVQTQVYLRTRLCPLCYSETPSH